MFCCIMQASGKIFDKMLPHFLKSAFSYDWLRRLSDARNWAGMGCSEVRIPANMVPALRPSMSM